MPLWLCDESLMYIYIWMLFHSSRILFINWECCTKLFKELKMIPYIELCYELFEDMRDSIHRVVHHISSYLSDVVVAVVDLYSVEWKSFRYTQLEWKTFQWRLVRLVGTFVCFSATQLTPISEIQRKNITVNNAMLKLMTVMMMMTTTKRTTHFIYSTHKSN